MIGAAMAEAGAVGIGRVTLSRRERLIMIEPRGAGMVATAETIIKRRSGHFVLRGK